MCKSTTVTSTASRPQATALRSTHRPSPTSGSTVPQTASSTRCARTEAGRARALAQQNSPKFAKIRRFPEPEAVPAETARLQYALLLASNCARPAAALRDRRPKRHGRRPRAREALALGEAEVRRRARGRARLRRRMENERNHPQTLRGSFSAVWTATIATK